jgi:hypothetical protein
MYIFICPYGDLLADCIITYSPIPIIKIGNLLGGNSFLSLLIFCNFLHCFYSRIYDQGIGDTLLDRDSVSVQSNLTQLKFSIGS